MKRMIRPLGMFVMAGMLFSAGMPPASAAEITVQDLAGKEAPAGAVWLDSKDLSSVKLGYGSVGAGKACGGKNPISINKQVFAHGIGVHAESVAEVYLKRKATRFVAAVGVDDQVGRGGSVTFEVWVDQVKKAESGVMRCGDAPKLISVDLTGARKMTLVVTGNGDGLDNDHADWGGAAVFAPDTAVRVGQEVSSDPLVWTTPGENAQGSMPLGNGDISLNTWVEPSGDLVLLIGKTDSFNEIGKLLKIGRVRVKFSPALSEDSYVQKLDIRKGEMTIASGDGKEAIILRVWVDANQPVIRVEADAELARDCTAQVELWRTQDKPHQEEKNAVGATSWHGEWSEKGLEGCGLKLLDLADTVVPANKGNELIWYHRNSQSIYASYMVAEHLGKAIATCPDPLTNRTFGAVMSGTGMVAEDDKTLKSTARATRRVISIAVLTEQVPEADAWVKDARALSLQARNSNVNSARKAHVAWWKAFWDRSYITITGDKQAEIVTRGYELQRYLLACCSRGPLPPKFNGATFTIGRPDTTPDYRKWGGCYWFQNNRWLNWPLLATGDTDLMESFFQMYVRMLPLLKDRTRTYFKHEGAYCAETFHFWGTYNMMDWGGWNRAETDVIASNPWVKYHWCSGIELVAMMLDRYAYTGDQVFAQKTLLPFAEAITTFYDQHYPREGSGKIRFEPATSLETWHKAVNPMPEVAGLRYVLPRLLALPKNLATEALRAMWRKTLADLPPIPTGERDGKKVLRPADTFSDCKNCENPELYAIFPFRLYGVGKPDLAVGKTSFDVRVNKQALCWSHDGLQAALLGDAETAKGIVLQKFSQPSTPQRFVAFYPPNNDESPDMDNGGTAMIGLQYMLMQCDGRKIVILPAWPKEWNAEFKLHAPLQTVVEGVVRGGTLVKLKVTPSSRRRDVVIADGSPVVVKSAK
ncbi:MAG: DUF5703 domain-containing protein [bacterium]